MSNFSRNCPKCEQELIYTYKNSYKKAVDNNQVCKLCAKRPATLSDEKIQQILLLNGGGSTNREISRMLKISWLTVKKYLKKYDRENNWCNVKPEMISETEAKCRICQKILAVSEFKIESNGVVYLHDVCKNIKCRNNKAYVKGRKSLEQRAVHDPNILLQRKYRNLKNKCKRVNITFNISEIDFIHQFLSQSYKCFYTDEEMILEFNAEPKKHGASRNALSIDKIIPDKGYVLGNVVFCCNKINFVKRDLSLDEIKKYLHTSFYERIINFLNKAN